MKWPVKWSSTTEYVDIDTGEVLTKHEAKKYIIIKTEKHGKLNYNKTGGHITWTKQCRRNPQGRLF